MSAPTWRWHRHNIQREADEYAETVLRYYKADSPDLPALRDPESSLYQTVEFWLDLKWEIPPEVREAVCA